MVGIVGESGCGKSVTSQSIMRLYDEKEEVSYSGTVRFEGENLMEIPYKEMDKIRGNRIAMIFQDALSSLNPVYTVGNQVVEAICIHQNVEKKEAWQKAVEMLMKVGISEPEKRMRQYPHELSGGMRQRVMIAIALCCKPDLLIADEPTTALDVTVQAQIMDLIQQLKEEENMGVILITHDMAVVAENCDRVIVMYLGQMVEEASVTDIFEHPLHPYTVGLIQSIPQMTTDSEQELFMIKGSLPLLTQIKKGCRFASRCPYATDKCREEEPELQKTGENHSVRCHFPRFGE
ncbi:MAG: ABC transporter ATP-binding protein [Roseburia sp.]|jgi:oligopeptide/dipeptide ABC transporter ATP-binding protein|nr:ABC transporter ATP-binding protein [Roseburia sp.]